MDKTYHPEHIESSIYQMWEAGGYFMPKGTGLPYSIVLPPPNVTGVLHMGHGFQDTLMDILIRYHRMMGDNTLWQPGTDHAGIATQMVVERKLETLGQTREAMGREAFVDEVWKWKAESGDNITRQMRRLGASADWSKERFTLDEGLSSAVKDVFVSLFDEGLIYRGKRLVNWDPSLQTAVSDLEVLTTEESGSLWYIDYLVVDSDEKVTIATTRPETLLGDAAVAVHPEDPRFKHLIGQKVHLPLCDRDIPIIADDYVDPDFGTGCLKITPAHDFNDYEVGLRHDLPMLNIFTKTAHLNNNVPLAYQGLDRFEARKQLLNDLTKAELLVKTEPHTLSIPRGERNNTILEPYLTHQWFVKVESLAKPAIEAVANGDIKFVPDNARNIYNEWMHNIQDWCISRQLWWGHQIPAWYDDDGRVYVAKDQAEVYEKYGLDKTVTLRQEDDVLDTWFSSALWPFSSLGWPDKTQTLETFYPTSTLVTGFDIIFFWVARMIMFGLKFKQEIPFKTVYFHGLIRDHDGKKMSKSKGNVLDPIDLIDGIDLDSLIEKRTRNMMQPRLKERVEKATRQQFKDGIAAYGTDALRFTFSSLASTSRDIRFDVSRLEGYRNFCNKLWNASRFVLMNVEGKTLTPVAFEALSPMDQWIHGEFNRTVLSIHKSLNAYRFDLASTSLYEFTWNTFCDWALEFAKVRLNDDSVSDPEKNATLYTLVFILERLLRLAHPFIPFITESIWQSLKGYLNITTKTLMIEDYPKAQELRLSESLEDDVLWVKAFISAIRTVKSEMNIAPGKTVSLLLKNASAEDKIRLKTYERYIFPLAKIASVEWLSANDSPPASMTTLVDTLEIHIPLEGLIDKQAEITRLEKGVMQLNQEITRLEAKLNNPNFVAKAPKAVVAKEHEKLTKAKDSLAKYQGKLGVL